MGWGGSVNHRYPHPACLTPSRPRGRHGAQLRREISQRGGMPALAESAGKGTGRPGCPANWFATSKARKPRPDHGRHISIRSLAKPGMLVTQADPQAHKRRHKLGQAPEQLRAGRAKARGFSCSTIGSALACWWCRGVWPREGWCQPCRMAAEESSTFAGRSGKPDSFAQRHRDWSCCG